MLISKDNNNMYYVKNSQGLSSAILGLYQHNLNAVVISNSNLKHLFLIEI